MYGRLQRDLPRRDLPRRDLPRRVAINEELSEKYISRVFIFANGR